MAPLDDEPEEAPPAGDPDAALPRTVPGAPVEP
jgi:hypothetical protein